jgi:hypothetical protein
MAVAVVDLVAERSTVGAQAGSQDRSWLDCNSTATGSENENENVMDIAADSRWSSKHRTGADALPYVGIADWTVKLQGSAV